MHQKGLLTYALNLIGNLVYIDEVDTGQLCNCYCPSCKEKLVAKNGGMKRVHHFAHASGVDCENAYETMLHQLAKLRVQEAFLSKEVFNVGFEYRSYCPHVKTCAFVRYGNCYISSHCCPIKIAKRSLKYLKFSSLQRFFESTDLNL